MKLYILILVCCFQSVFSTEPVSYYLHTINGSSNNVILDGSDIDFTVPLVFIIHGWIQSFKSGHYIELTRAYNNIGKNVILVDWESLAAEYYLKSTKNTNVVGNHLGGFLVYLLNFGLDPTKVHIVGHSLGAHVAGFAGKYFQKKSGNKVKRITGLDPAGWGFYKLAPFDNKMRRLDKDDAELVVILNTSVMYGLSRDVGKVTFYANNGIHQPGCPFDDDPNTKPMFCSHQRSMSYMIESMTLKNFVGRTRCTFTAKECMISELVFYENIPSDAEGIYYFETNIRQPYGKG